MKTKAIREKMASIDALIAEICNPKLDEKTRIEKGGAMKEALKSAHTLLDEEEAEHCSLLEILGEKILNPGPEPPKKEKDDPLGIDEPKPIDEALEDFVEKHSEVFN